MRISNNVSAKDLNSFGIDVSINTLIELQSKEDLYHLSDFDSSSIKILGGGSNVLLTNTIEQPLISVNHKGIELVKEEEEYVLVSFAAGEVWHDAVLWAVENGYGGIENLSLIPGKCGAAPIQNIGAYGVEIKDVLHALKAFHLKENIECTFHNQECAFAYRNSHFKNKWKGKYLITEIILKLTKPGFHKLNISYGAISKHLEDKGVTQATIADVSETVISIRQLKLPDPKVVGNAGSFFKNPIIDIEKFTELQAQYENIPNYPAGENIKLAAGWLIDQCGWKGKVVGDTGTYKNQALVLVNRGEATGLEILAVAEKIQKDVLEKFGVTLEREVNVW